MKGPVPVGHYDAVWERKRDCSGEGDIRPGTRLDLGAKLVGRGDRLLDVGCGGGALARLVGSRFRFIAGIDFSSVGAESALAGGTRAIVADLNRFAFPIRDGCCDAVACLDVIEHVLNPRLLMSEIARVLQPGGIGVITTPNIQYWRHIWSIVRGRFPPTSTDPEGYDGGHLHYFTFGDVERLAVEAGLEVAHRQGIINAPNYGIKNRVLRVILGERFVREFRTFGILLLLRRPAPEEDGP